MSVNFNNLPAPIAHKIKQSVARIRRIIFWRGMAATVAVAVASLLLIMGIDAVSVMYSTWIRLALTVSGILLTAGTWYMMVYRPVKREITARQIATLIEERHPELEERLSTVVELMTAKEDVARGSGTLFDELKKMAEEDVAGVKVNKEFTTRTVRPKLLAALAASTVLVALCLANPTITIRLAKRAVMPFASMDNVYADNLLVSPGDVTVLVGEPLDVLLTVNGGFPGQAYVLREISDKKGTREISERMQNNYAIDQTMQQDDKTRAYIHRFPMVDRSFKYRVSCGHALTRYYSVRAVLRPEVTNIVYRYSYPDYTGKDTVEVSGGPVELASIAGTTVDVMAFLNRPDAEASMKLFSGDTDEGENNHGKEQVSDGVIKWTFAIEPEMNSEWEIRVADTNGFGGATASMPIQAVPDSAPVITLTQPEKHELTLPPHGRITVKYVVTDDFGVTSNELWAARGSDPMRRWLRLEPPVKNAADAWIGQCTIDLAEITLTDANVIRFKLKTWDNLPAELGGPNGAETSELTITVDREAMTMENQTREAVKDQFGDLLSGVYDRLKESLECAVFVDNKLAKRQMLDDMDREKINSIQKDTALSVDIVTELMNSLADSEFEPLQKDLKTLLSQTLVPVRNKAEQAQLASEAQLPVLMHEVRKLLEQALKHIEQVDDLANDFAAKLEELDKLAEMAEEEQALAEKAAELERLAKEAEEMSGEKKDGEDGEDAENGEDGEKKDDANGEKSDADKDAEAERERLMEEYEQNFDLWLEEQKKIADKLADMYNKTPEGLEEAGERMKKEVLEKARKLSDMIQDIEKLLTQQRKLLEITYGLAGSTTRPENARRIAKITSRLRGKFSPEQRAGRVEGTISAKAGECADKLKEITTDVNAYGEALTGTADKSLRCVESLRNASQSADEAAATLKTLPNLQLRDIDIAKKSLNKQKETVKHLEDAKDWIKKVAQEMIDAVEGNKIEFNQDNMNGENFEPPPFDAEDMRNTLEMLRQAIEDLQRLSDEFNRDSDLGDQDYNQQSQDNNWESPRNPDQEWDGQKDENSEQNKDQEGNRDPNQKWDGQKDENSEQNKNQEGNRDPNQKWDGQKDPNAQQQQQQQGSKNQQRQDAMQRAQDAAQKASQMMRQMAQNAADKMGVPQSKQKSNQKSQQRSDQKSDKHDQSDQLENIGGIPARLKGKMSERDWFRFASALKGGAIDEDLESVPPEYRELAKMYFQELARQADGK